MSTTYAASLRAQAIEKTKISNPGIYTRFSMSNAEKIETKPDMPFFKFTFEGTTADEYMDLALFLNKKDFISNGKITITKKQAEDRLILKLLEICDAIGTQGEVDKYLTTDYEKNYTTMFAYINKQRVQPNRFVNFKAIMDNRDEWVKMSENAGTASCPAIEKHVEGKDNNCKFSQWEIDKGLTRRQKPRDTSSYTSASSSATKFESSPFPVDAPLTAAEMEELPF